MRRQVWDRIVAKRPCSRLGDPDVDPDDESEDEEDEDGDEDDEEDEDDGDGGEKWYVGGGRQLRRNAPPVLDFPPRSPYTWPVS